ncbi:MAG: ELM1/GtrOC1 family putative glycosyltransferase, partial [Alphaproteobacteria bacterium]|nr:ELM1/GtrOC1 family putative glycosyltransferase [Alphaproteobacteria bacterium]
RSKVYDFGISELKALADNLRILAKKSDGSLLITASRRSPPATEKILSETLSDCPHYIWDGQGDNPYFGFLGLADYIVVTCDSANMVSEACATGKPVYVFHMQANRKTKFDIFHQSLEAGGYCRKLGDSLENWRYDPLNETERLADIVISRLGYE